MERNSDLIVMAAYAPLLVNVNPGGMQWETDLIGYDAMKSYGSPELLRAGMFAKYLGDQTLDRKSKERARSSSIQSRSDSKKKQIYLKLVNASSDPQPVDIKFEGAKVAATGKLVTLSAHNTQATNTLQQPTNIVPVESAMHNAGSEIHHTMPPYSIQVLVLDQH